jgi:hypothetical protein
MLCVGDQKVSGTPRTNWRLHSDRSLTIWSGDVIVVVGRFGGLLPSPLWRGFKVPSALRIAAASSRYLRNLRHQY